MDDTTPLHVVGAGGSAPCIVEAAQAQGWRLVRVYDDHQSLGTPVCAGARVKGTTADIPEAATAVCAVNGTPASRRAVCERLQHRVTWISCLVSPRAYVSSSARLDEGCVVLQGASVACLASLGRHCLINTGAIVSHHNVLGAYVHVAPGAVLCGYVTVGDNVMLGAGCRVVNGRSRDSPLRIASNVVVGAGAVVTKSLLEPGVYVGVPAARRPEPSPV